MSFVNKKQKSFMSRKIFMAVQSSIHPQLAMFFFSKHFMLITSILPSIVFLSPGVLQKHIKADTLSHSQSPSIHQQSQNSPVPPSTPHS